MWGPRKKQAGGIHDRKLYQAHQHAITKTPNDVLDEHRQGEMVNWWINRNYVRRIREMERNSHTQIWNRDEYKESEIKYETKRDERTRAKSQIDTKQVESENCDFKTEAKRDESQHAEDATETRQNVSFERDVSAKFLSRADIITSDKGKIRGLSQITL